MNNAAEDSVRNFYAAVGWEEEQLFSQLGNLKSVVEQGDMRTKLKRALLVLFRPAANGPARDLLDLIARPPVYRQWIEGAIRPHV